MICITDVYKGPCVNLVNFSVSYNSWIYLRQTFWLDVCQTYSSNNYNSVCKHCAKVFSVNNEWWYKNEVITIQP